MVKKLYAPLKTVFKNYKRTALNRSILAIWRRITLTGITENTSAWDKKRIRLLNGICVIGMSVLAVFCISYTDAAHRLTFWESLQGLLAYGFVFLLTSRHRFNTATHFFNIYNIISYSFQAISHGSVDAVEYILVASSVAGMLIFRDTWIIVIYFILNGIAFGICKYSFTVMKPFLFMPNGENLYNTNHVLLFLLLFLIVYYFKSENDLQEKLLESRNTNLSEEKAKSENLLMNILPNDTAEELKQTGTAIPRSFEMVTVMFTDFKNFTKAAEALHPEKLVAEIHYYFSVFDQIMLKHNIEKIKTIGDSYMCAGGLPKENDTNAVDMVTAALEIQEFMHQHKQQKELSNELFFECRLGIHTGPVIAGIVGTRKFAYDIWGDTVNIASRMESSGDIGKVNVSGSTYHFIKDHFDCTYRGRVAAKNKGEIDMYFVEQPVNHRAN